jgi:hypothetical protein
MTDVDTALARMLERQQAERRAQTDAARKAGSPRVVSYPTPTGLIQPPPTLSTTSPRRLIVATPLAIPTQEDLCSSVSYPLRLTAGAQQAVLYPASPPGNAGAEGASPSRKAPSAWLSEVLTFIDLQTLGEEFVYVMYIRTGFCPSFSLSLFHCITLVFVHLLTCRRWGKSGSMYVYIRVLSLPFCVLPRVHCITLVFYTCIVSWNYKHRGSPIIWNTCICPSGLWRVSIVPWVWYRCLAGHTPSLLPLPQSRHCHPVMFMLEASHSL